MLEESWELKHTVSAWHALVTFLTVTQLQVYHVNLAHQVNDLQLGYYLQNVSSYDHLQLRIVVNVFQDICLGWLARSKFQFYAHMI